MGSGGGSTTTVQKADPWEGLQPYLLGSTREVRILKPDAKKEVAREWVDQSGDRDGYWKEVEYYPEDAYITQTQNIPGLYPEAARIYQQYIQMPEELRRIMEERIAMLAMFAGVPQLGMDLAQRTLSGAFSPQLMNVPYTSPFKAQE